jgi:hypothetical protein
MKISPKFLATVSVVVLLALFGGSFLAGTQEAARNNAEAKSAAACFKGNAWSSVSYTKAAIPGSAIDTHETEAFYHGIIIDPDANRVMSSFIKCLGDQGYSIRAKPASANSGTTLMAGGSTKNASISIYVEPNASSSQVDMSFNFK